jgi:hypothetical protein
VVPFSWRKGGPYQVAQHPQSGPYQLAHDIYVPDGTEATELSSGDHCSDVQNGKLRCSWQTSLEKGNPFRVEIDLERPERFAGTQARAEVYSASNPPENDSDPYNNYLTLDLS